MNVLIPFDFDDRKKNWI